MNVQTLKGFRDFLPKEERKRQYVMNTLKQVFELYGFEPLETPALEYEEILLGKYGEEGDKLMYRFKDLGERNVALRYDQTVPLARVVAQYQNELPMPFKRYQMQSVWRAENTQKGRFREFMQCDIDIVGSDSALSDAEVIALAARSIEKLGFKNYKIIINDRNVFNKLSNVLQDKNDLSSIIRTVDKLKKIGREGVLDELVKKGFSTEKATFILQSIESTQPTEKINQVFSYLEKFDIDKSKYEFSPTLARGLDYYTGIIFEVEINGYTSGSVCGGGRYDNLIGMFANTQIPAVGFAFGFDRVIEAMDELNLFPQEVNDSVAKVLVTVFNSELKDESIEISSRLRSNNINAEVYLDGNAKLDKQIKYADKKGIPYVIVIGPDEAKENKITIKNLKNREQKTISKEELIKELK